MSIKAVSYCRYSTDNQTENSIMYQMSAAEEYCKKHGMVLIDVYSDEAKTGTNTNREGLQRLIKDCDTIEVSIKGTARQSPIVFL